MGQMKHWDRLVYILGTANKNVTVFLPCDGICKPGPINPWPGICISEEYIDCIDESPWPWIISCRCDNSWRPKRQQKCKNSHREKKQGNLECTEKIFNYWPPSLNFYIHLGSIYVSKYNKLYITNLGRN